MVIGAFVRGLSMRDVESLCEQAGLGKLFKSTASRICSELRERFAAFQRRDLYDIHVAALFLDAVFLSVRPDGPKEGVLVAWGFPDDDDISRRRLVNSRIYADWFHPAGIEAEPEAGIARSWAQTRNFLFERAHGDFSIRDRTVLDVVRPTSPASRRRHGCAQPPASPGPRSSSASRLARRRSSGSSRQA